MKNIPYPVHPINQTGECRPQKTLRILENRFKKFDSQKRDDFKYAFLTSTASSYFFNHLSLRCRRKSAIITTNLSFERWSEIFGDTVLTASMVGRLTNRTLYNNHEQKILQGKGNKINDRKMKNTLYYSQPP